MAQVAESYLSEMQKVAGEDGLADAEIARLLKSVQAAQFKRSEVIPEDADSSFKPRSLVEIAFEAEKKRQEDAARQLAVEKAAQLAAQRAEQQAENAPENAAENTAENAAENAGANQTAAQAKAGQHTPDMGQAASHIADIPETGTMAAPASPQPASAQALYQQQEAEQDAAAVQAREQREAEDASLRAQAEEEGYKRGFESGLEAARSAEPTEEEKAHAAAKEQERADIISRLETVIAAAASAEAVDVSELVPVLEQAVLRLASERAGLAIRENPQGLVQRIEHLVEKVKSGAKAISVTLHPDDLKAVNTWRPTVSAHSAWTWRADASFVSGDIQLKLDGITVIDLLGTDTGIRPADRAESLLSAPTPVMQAEEELPEQPIEELQAEELQAEQPEPPLSEEPHPDEPLIAQSAEAMGERETKGESQAEGEAEAEAETEALAEKSGLDVDNPTS